MRLTARQTQVARLVGEGLPYKAIGARLGISVRTVEHHVYLVAHLVNGGELTPYRRVQQWAIRRRLRKTA